jgi:hypothetical protein
MNSEIAPTARLVTANERYGMRRGCCHQKIAHDHISRAAHGVRLFAASQIVPTQMSLKLRAWRKIEYFIEYD